MLNLINQHRNQNVTISIPELELSKNVTLEDGTIELQMSTDRIEY